MESSSRWLAIFRKDFQVRRYWIAAMKALKGLLLVLDMKSDSDAVTVSTMSLVSMWITKLATFHFRQSSLQAGKQGLILVAPAPASKSNESTPMMALGNNSLLGLTRSVQMQNFFEGHRFTLLYSTGYKTEAERKGTAETLIAALTQNDKFTLESNGKIYMSDGKVIQAAETSMSRVEGYRKLGGRLVGIVALKTAIRSNTQRAVNLLQASGISRQQMQLGSAGLIALAFIWLACRGWIPNIAYMAVGAVLWRSVYAGISAGKAKSSRQVRSRKDGETCCTAVFLGSGGHTGEAIQLLSALDPARYSPRTYIFCTGDIMSVTKAKAFENELASQTSHHEQHDAKDASTCPDYRLIELPRARKVGQSYFSSIGTTLYSMMISLWKLAIEPIVKGRHKQMPDLLIVNGPGTCVVVVLIYRLLRLIGQRSPEIIYVESFARVTSLSLSGKILKHVVDRFIVQWPVEGKSETIKTEGVLASKAVSQDSKVEYAGWLI
ncbi:hypothetical protein NliqN6_5257 [Naganishia liquefaciens]|uniref:UDP-N-acetylglucosamine transferase subunit ALG14 n=1 Tax=Naganishia liquefaciens TaxID=104408 RepID=A0A8H3YGH2_9TREE|nr:hypothetical protein NliqN6_5257 [Naganishia liquefaciens]